MTYNLCVVTNKNMCTLLFLIQLLFL